MDNEKDDVFAREGLSKDNFTTDCNSSKFQSATKESKNPDRHGGRKLNKRRYSVV
jgi:hypothetical protein